MPRKREGGTTGAPVRAGTGSGQGSPPPPKSDIALHAEAIRLHAKAVDKLASALIAHTAATTLPPLTQAQKVGELGKIFGIPVTAKTPLSAVKGGPGAVSAYYEKIDNWALFVQRNLFLNIAAADQASDFGGLADAIN